MASDKTDPYGRKRDQIPLSNINPGYEDELQADYPLPRPHHPVYSEAGPAIPMDRRGSQASSSEGGIRQRSNWVRESAPRDTAILLESLPSKQLEKMASEVANDGEAWKKKSRKQKSFHGTMHIPRGKNVSEELLQQVRDNPDIADEMEEELKGLTLHMSDKRKLKSQVSIKRKEPKQLTRWKRMKYNFSIMWKHFKYKLAEFGYFLKLWEGHLKKIEGHFGTGVLSYFLFLKWLFYINIPVFVFTFGFVILPQILYRHWVQEPSGYTQDVTFTGVELLTGASWFTNTELYYGYYTNATLQLGKSDSKYDMKYAYLFTCAGYYIMCMIILAISISKSYKKNYIEGSGAFDFYYVSRVFCGWDYGITAKSSAELRHKSIFNEVREYLSGTRTDEEEKTSSQKCKLFFIRLMTNLLIIAMIGASGYLIFYITDTQSVSVDIKILSEMAMPLCVSGVNLILPFVFALLARLESYERPKHELYINMSRTMLLKAVTLGVLVYYWYRRLNTDCWETFVGQQIYSLVVVDFIFILLTTFVMEFIRRLLKEYCCKDSMAYPEFEIGRNTLNLIYSQALCWLGTYFAPMLSLVMIIKLFLLFYVKRVSVIQNCRPSLRPWRASRAHTIFLAFLFCFFIMTFAAFACAVILIHPCGVCRTGVGNSSILCNSCKYWVHKKCSGLKHLRENPEFSLKPSDTCGPFRYHETSYEIVIELVDYLKAEYNALHTVVQIVSSSGFIAFTLVVLIVLTYYMRIVMVGHREMVDLLRQQLSMEGRDKAYLLKMLQDVNRKTRHMSPRQEYSSRLLSPDVAASSVGGSISSTSRGGRQFIKQLAATGEMRKSEASPVTPRRRQNQGMSGAASP